MERGPQSNTEIIGKGSLNLQSVAEELGVSEHGLMWAAIETVMLDLLQREGAEDLKQKLAVRAQEIDLELENQEHYSVPVATVTPTVTANIRVPEPPPQASTFSQTPNSDADRERKDRRRVQNREAKRRSRQRRRALHLPEPKDDPSYLTTTAISQLTGLSPQYVWELIQQGVLKGERRGRQWFIAHESFDDYLNKRDIDIRHPRNANGRGSDSLVTSAHGAD